MDWLPARLVFCLSSTFWTLAPRDHVTYGQAQGLSGNTSPCGECVFFNLEDSMPPEVEEDYLHTLQFGIDKEYVYRKNLEYELAILSRYVVNKEKYES